MHGFKRLFIGMFLVTLFLFGFSIKASAATLNSVVMPAAKACTDECKDINGNTCQSIFGDPSKCGCPAYWMQQALTILKYVAIAALIVLSLLDFIKALISGDKDALKKAASSTAKRFIFCVLIFFLPYIVSFLMDFIGAFGTCGIS